MITKYCWAADEFSMGLTPTVVAGAADPDFPVTNLAIPQPSIYFKSTGTSVTLQWNRGSAGTFGLMAPIHTNLIGATVKIRVSNDPTFLSGVTEFTFTLPLIDADKYFDNAVLDLVALAAPSAQYVQLQVQGNASVVIIGGTSFNSTTRTMPGSIQAKPAPNFGDYNPRITPLATAAQVQQVFQNFGRLRYLAGIVKDTPDNLNVIRDWERSSGGEDQAFLVVPDATVNSAWFARWATTVSPTQPMVDHQDFNVSGDYPLLYSMPVGWREVARGRALGTV